MCYSKMSVAPFLVVVFLHFEKYMFDIVVHNYLFDSLSTFLLFGIACAIALLACLLIR